MEQAVDYGVDLDTFRQIPNMDEFESDLSVTATTECFNTLDDSDEVDKLQEML